MYKITFYLKAIHLLAFCVFNSLLRLRCRSVHSDETLLKQTSLLSTAGWCLWQLRPSTLPWITRPNPLPHKLGPSSENVIYGACRIKNLPSYPRSLCECRFVWPVITCLLVSSLHIIVFLMLQDEAGEVLSRFEVFNSVEVLAPGIELDDLGSLLNSGESSS